MEEFEFLHWRPTPIWPEDFRKLTGEIVIQIAESDRRDHDDLSLETPFDLLGLFEGRGSPSAEPADRRRPEKNRINGLSGAPCSTTGPKTRNVETSSPMC